MQDDSSLKILQTSTETAGISKAVANLRAAAQAALVRSRRSRLMLAQETRKALQSHRARIRGVAEGICHATRKSIEGAGAVVRETEEADWDRTWAFTIEGDAGLSVTEHDIVSVIEQHPEGVTLPEIGNELGADWRGLVNWSRRLVIEGKAEKLDELFYPARE